MTIDELVRQYNDRCGWVSLVPTWHLATCLEQLETTGTVLEAALILDTGATESSRGSYKIAVATSAGLALIDIDYPKAHEETSLSATFVDWGSVSGFKLEAAFSPRDNPSSRWSLHLDAPSLTVLSSRLNREDDVLRFAATVLRHPAGR